MSTEQLIPVTFTVGAETYTAQARPMNIVHELMDKHLPANILHAHRLRVLAPNGDLIYPDMFVGEIAAHYGSANLTIEATPLRKDAGEWTNLGFDHIALAVTDRAKARDFFHIGLKLKIVRDDDHLAVVTTGNTAIFLFQNAPGAPLSDGIPSRIHHIGFVVDNLEAAYGHLVRSFPDFVSEFTLLERQERLSLYGHVTFGDVRFMIQLSEIKPEYRGLRETEFTKVMYDYAAQDYGVRLG